MIPIEDEDENSDKDDLSFSMTRSHFRVWDFFSLCQDQTSIAMGMEHAHYFPRGKASKVAQMLPVSRFHTNLTTAGVIDSFIFGR